MVLIDFHQLAVLYKLARCDGGTNSCRSSPPPMPVPVPSKPQSRAVKHEFLVPSVPIPKTPERNPLIPLPSVNQTPCSRGSAAIHKLGSGPERPKKRTSSKYEEYITQDFDRHRVFIEIEAFMKRALHVPDDWKEQWSSTIDKVKRDHRFVQFQMKYTALCQDPDVDEEAFYQPLVGMVNSIYKVTEDKRSDRSVQPKTSLRYIRNAPRRVLGGIMPELSPDIVAVKKGFTRHLPGAARTLCVDSDSNITWAQPMQVLEVKPSNKTLINGSQMPRLKVDGE
jgi:hypothetical protein